MSATARPEAPVVSYDGPVVAVRHVDHHALPEARLADRVAHEHRAIVEPQHPAVSRDHPVLRDERLPASEKLDALLAVWKKARVRRV